MPDAPFDIQRADDLERLAELASKRGDKELELKALRAMDKMRQEVLATPAVDEQSADTPDFQTFGELRSFTESLPDDDPRKPQLMDRVETRKKEIQKDQPLFWRMVDKVGEATGLATVSGAVKDFQDETVEPAADKLLDNPLGRAAGEVSSGAVREFADIGDFLTIDQVNAWRQVFGKEPDVPTIRKVLGAMANEGLEEGYMDEGLAKDILSGAGEVIPTAVLGGAGMRQLASQVPKTVGPGTVGQNVVRQMGSTTPKADVAFGAASGAGSEIGEEVGGPTGRAIGAIAGPMAAGGVGAAVSPKPNLPPGATRSSKVAEQMRAISQADDAAKQTGIDLFQAQKTLNPDKLRAQRFLPELSPTAQKAAAALSKQNEQASKAVDDFVRSVAPDDAVVRGPEQFRSAARRSVEAAKELREARTSPIYKAAFKDAADNGIEVEVSPVRATAARIAEQFPEKGQVSAKMRRILGLLKGKTVKETVQPRSGQAGVTTGKKVKPQTVERSTPPSLEKLHNVKLEIDQMLNTRDDSIGNTTKAQLMKVKEVLLRQMEKASPKYIEANEQFAKESMPYNRLREGIIGKVAGMDDTQLKNISRRIFDPGQTNRQVVKQAKQIIDDVDPDAWNLLMRSEIERRLGSLKPEIGTSTENLPSKMKNAIFGSGKSRDALFAGMGPEQQKVARMLETGLTRAGLGRPGGSETAGRGEFLNEMGRGGILRTIKNWLRGPIDETVGIGDETLFNRRVKALADALFDPAWTPEAKEALKDPSGKSLGFLLYQVADQNERTDGSQSPSQQERQQTPPPPRARAQTR